MASETIVWSMNIIATAKIIATRVSRWFELLLEDIRDAPFGSETGLACGPSHRALAVTSVPTY